MLGQGMHAEVEELSAELERTAKWAKEAEHRATLLDDKLGGVLRQAVDLRADNERLRARAEQAELQLAGCSVAALGWNESPAKPGDYGYSASYGDVLKLRRDFEELTVRATALGRENERLLGELSAKDNRIDDDTKTINRLREDISSLRSSLSSLDELLED